MRQTSQGLQITPCRQSLCWKCPIKRMMWSYCNAVRQPRYDWTVISTDTTNYGKGSREFLFRKVIPSGVFTIKVIWWPLVFISQPRGLLRDSCEWLVSWVSASSLWHDIRLLRLPPCSPKPTHQLASPQPLQPVWRRRPQLEQGGQRGPGGGGRWNSSSLSRHGVPVTSLTVRGWRLLAATVARDAWAEICRRCSRWGQNSVTRAPHTWEGLINHLHQTERHSNDLAPPCVWQFLAPPFGVFIRRSAPALARAPPDLRPEGKKEKQMWWGKSQPATVRVLAAAYAKRFIVSQRSDYFRQANKHLTLVWLKHLYTRMWSNGRTPEGTVEPLEYYSELLNECAVHRPNY